MRTICRALAYIPKDLLSGQKFRSACFWPKKTPFLMVYPRQLIMGVPWLQRPSNKLTSSIHRWLIASATGFWADPSFNPLTFCSATTDFSVFRPKFGTSVCAPPPEQKWVKYFTTNTIFGISGMCSFFRAILVCVQKLKGRSLLCTKVGARRNLLLFMPKYESRVERSEWPLSIPSIAPQGMN